MNAANAASVEIETGERFSFGTNWMRFLRTLDDARIGRAEQSLQTMTRRESLAGLHFLDVGSGSGLFSLAARRLGAVVHSFDYDPQSVACARELKRLYFTDDEEWTIEQGSVLDADYLSRLGSYDIVYSWGVLHHTGAMWQAMENVVPLVAPEGALFIAIYNNQGYKTRHWARIKRTYNRQTWTRPLLLTYGLARGWGLTTLLDFYHLRPFASWRTYHAERGMSPWRDVVDWIGGWPYEAATPEAVFRFYRDRGFVLEEMVTRQGLGCNEFVFRKPAAQ